MRIALIGPGIMPIPPKGWGAVEILIWDYYQELTHQGHKVTIINIQNRQEIIRQINENPFDFVHIHYDVFYDIIPHLKCPLIAITSHYPYIDDIEKHDKDGYTPIYRFLTQSEYSFINMPISQRDYQQFKKDTSVKERIIIPIESGASHHVFKFDEQPRYLNRSICLGKIEPRKRQTQLQSISTIDFVGTIADNQFQVDKKQYLGEWSKEYLYEHLTDYSNLVLLSQNENGYPLVVKEAFMAGLGVVLSKNAVDCIEHIDVPFITIIPEEKILEKDMIYIESKIEENRRISNTMRNDIRAYGIKHFSYEKIVKHYIKEIQLRMKKKITIIGPASPIPPKGWGAVESLIWDYKLMLETHGWNVQIINIASDKEIIKKVNDYQPDIIHIHYDDFWYLWDKFDCKKVIVTNHYAYLEHPTLRKKDHLNGISQSKTLIHCLSKGIQDVYVKEYNVPIERTFVLPNGANHNLFHYREEALYKDRSIYLAKIDYRKRQYVYQNLDFIDFVGNLADGNFNPRRSNYKGEWNKDYLYQHLSDYSNLVLLSDGEAHPLVCCEALICGLGLVVSEFAAANLDMSLPWIDVIPTHRLNDIAYVSEIIKENQLKSLVYRSQIRAYGLREFTWQVIIQRYLKIIKQFFD